MLRTLFYTLLGSLMATAWAHQATTAAGLVTALALVMVAHLPTQPASPAPAMSSPIKTKRKKAIRALLPACCAKCGSTEDLTIDHIVPRVRGGTNELANLQTLCAPCNQQKSRKEQRYGRPAEYKTIKPPMITKLALLTEPAGFTVQVSTTHRTYAGALAHFTELLAQFTQEERRREIATAARAAAAAGGPVSTNTTELPHRWEGPGHDRQPLPPASEAEPPWPAPPLSRVRPPRPHRCPPSAAQQAVA